MMRSAYNARLSEEFHKWSGAPLGFVSQLTSSMFSLASLNKLGQVTTLPL
jgi:hypothetical protein